MTSHKLKQVEIYTDGACSGNPGPGGWGAVLLFQGQEKELKGGQADTTNNQMELQAAIEGLAALKERCQVTLYTDSTYVQKGITEWLSQWKKRNWKTSTNKPVKNKTYWQNLDEQAQRHQVTWKWIKGHNLHEYNERADELARSGIKKS